MSKEKAAGFTRAGAERILSAVSRVEGVPVVDIPAVDRGRSSSEPTPVGFINQTTEVIPPFGCFRAVTPRQFDATRSLVQAVKPTSENQGYEVGVNGGAPVAVGKIGQMQTGYIVKVRYEKPSTYAGRTDRAYPYVGLAVGAVDSFATNFYGHDFICRGVVSYSQAESFWSLISATVIPKTEAFQISMECTNDDVEDNLGTATEKAKLLYNVRYKKNTSANTDPTIALLRANHSPDNSGSLFSRPLLGRVKPAKSGLGMWRPYTSQGAGATARHLDIIWCDEISEFTTC